MGGLSKNKLRQTLARVFRLSSWKIALILILLGFLAATLLRFDHIKMTELREAVMAADEANDDEKISSALEALHSFTLKHIIFNTIEDNGQQQIVFGTGPFYLENQYLRKANEAVAAAQKEIQNNSSNPNGNIYKKVASVCDAQGKRYGWRYPDKRYINCWVNELSAYPSLSSMDAYGAASLPSTELFRHEYSSPIWYPCASGIVILLCLILALILAVRLVIWIVLRLAIVVVEHSGKK
jgi:hypothetical protein